MRKYNINFILNGEEIQHQVETNKTLLKMLREDFDLTGAKEGCGLGECGACTVLVNNKPVNSCLMLAVEADGKEIITVEGLSSGTKLDEIQLSFVKNGALQCGYCTPGMIITTKALLQENPTPTEEEVIEALSGNLCRCTGYKKIIEAVMELSNKNKINQ